MTEVEALVRGRNLILAEIDPELEKDNSRDKFVYYRLKQSDIVRRFEKAENLDVHFGKGFEERVKNGNLFEF